jgi:hypothetical protein
MIRAFLGTAVALVALALPVAAVADCTRAVENQ